MTELKESSQHIVLKPSPLYFSTYTSFISTSSPYAIFNALKTCFISDIIDYEHIKNKIYGYTRYNGDRIYFLITVFDNQNSEVLIEFQRLNGCCILFNKFYYNTLKDIISNNIIFIRRAHMEHGNIEFLENITPDIKFDIDMQPIYNMPDHDYIKTLLISLSKDVCSKYINESRNASQALIHMHKYIADVKYFNDTDIANIIGSVMQSKCDDMVLENICILLSLLCKDINIKSYLVNKLRFYMLNILKISDSLELRYIKRLITKELEL